MTDFWHVNDENLALVESIEDQLCNITDVLNEIKELPLVYDIYEIVSTVVSIV